MPPNSIPASNYPLANTLFQVVVEGAPLDVVVAATHLMGDVVCFNHWFYKVGKDLEEEDALNAADVLESSTQAVEAARVAYAA